MGRIDEEVSSFLNMIMFEKEEDLIDTDATSSRSLFEKEEDSIDKEASSSSYTILFEYEDEEASSSLNTIVCEEERPARNRCPPRSAGTRRGTSRVQITNDI